MCLCLSAERPRLRRGGWQLYDGGVPKEEGHRVKDMVEGWPWPCERRAGLGSSGQFPSTVKDKGGSPVRSKGPGTGKAQAVRL